jgi:hypothetical protein
MRTVAERRLQAAVIAIAMLGGCATYPTSKTTAKVGGYMLLASAAFEAAALIVAAERSRRLQGDNVYPLVAGGVLLGVSVIVGGAGLIGMVVHDKPAEPLPGPEKPPDPSVVARLRAQDLMKQAVAASYARDCAAVKRREAEVREIDPDFYVTVFARDAVIKKCLEAGARAAPLGTPPPSP